MGGIYCFVVTLTLIDVEGGWRGGLCGVHKQVSARPINPFLPPLLLLFPDRPTPIHPQPTHTTETATATMYRQAMLARTALRASRTRGFATAADAPAADFASQRQAVRQHAVGMSPLGHMDRIVTLTMDRDY